MSGSDVGREGEDARFGLMQRGRRNIAVDLKNPKGVEAALRLIDQADGADRRLSAGRHGAARPRPRYLPRAQPEAGVRPDDRLGPGRADRPHRRARHQLHRAVGRAVQHRQAGGPPVPPLNLVGDFGGGALYLAMGVLAGIISARATGKGQVIDCSMVEGSASLMMMMYGALAAGAWNENRASNRTDGGAPYYHVYETKDGEHVAVGSIEPQFYAVLLKHTGLAGEKLPAADRPHELARHAAAPCPHLQDQDPRRMDRDHGADRYLLCPGAAHVGSLRAPAQRPPPAALSMSPASSSRGRRRAFSAPRPGCSARRPASASTPTTSCAIGVFRPPRSRRCTKAVLSRRRSFR